MTPFERYRQGEQTAASGVADAYVPAAYRLAFTLLEDAADAEAAAQEGLALALELAPVFDPAVDDERRWILSLVRRKALERRRGRTRSRWPGRGRSIAKVDLPHHIVERLHGLSPEVAARAVGVLASGQGEAVWQAFAQGRSPAEIGADQGISVWEARERLRRGLQDIQDQLAGHEVAE
ncbi:MAG: sigma factor [Dehalococcoidia bacterium]